MRKVIAATFVSLDGVMQAPGGPEEDTAGGFQFGGWTFPHWDDVMGEAMGATFNAPFDLLLGRKTYEIFAAHWPQIDNDPIADSFNAVTKYVATRSRCCSGGWCSPKPCAGRRNFCRVSEYNCSVIGAVPARKPIFCAHAR